VGCWPVHSTARIPLGRFKIIGAESQTGKNCASALALDDFHPSHNCPAVTIGPPFPSTKQIRSVVKRPKFVGRCLGPGRARKFHTHWHARTAKKTYQMCNIQKDHRAPGVLPADLSTFTHANNRATWTSPPQLLLVYRKDAQTQRVGRARSPLRAGVGCANLACGFESCFPRSYERGYEPLVCWCGKHALDSGCGGQRTASPTADQVLSKRRAPRRGPVSAPHSKSPGRAQDTKTCVWIGHNPPVKFIGHRPAVPGSAPQPTSPVMLLYKNRALFRD